MNIIRILFIYDIECDSDESIILEISETIKLNCNAVSNTYRESVIMWYCGIKKKYI